MKLKINKTVQTVIKILLSLAALFFVFSKIDFPEVVEIYKNSSAFLILIALLLFALSKLIAAFRLNRYFLATGISLTEKFNIRLYMLGMFYNLFLPGGIGGDGYKIYLLNKKSEVKAGKIFWAVFHDRLNGVLALFCIAVFLTLFTNFPVGFSYKLWIWLLIPAGILFMFFIIKKYYRQFTPIFSKVTALSFLVQLIQSLSAFVIFRAIGGSGHETEYLFIFLISSIVSMLPITIGGIGTRELTFLYGSKLLSLDQNLSIAMSLMFYLITAFVSFWGIYFSLNTKWEEGK